MVCSQIRGWLSWCRGYFISSGCRNIAVGFAWKSTSPSSSNSVSIAWTPKPERRFFVRLRRPCTTPGRVWLESTGACKARLTAQHILAWCKTIVGVPEVWVSDTASHFKNHMMAALEKSVGVDKRFSVANSPWSNVTYERKLREVVRTLKAMIQEERRNTQDWLELVPAVQCCLLYTSPSPRDRQKSRMPSSA